MELYINTIKTKINLLSLHKDNLLLHKIKQLHAMFQINPSHPPLLQPKPPEQKKDYPPKISEDSL